jgi:translation initiation factor 1
MKNNDWKERLGVTYSTNPDFRYRTEEVAEATTLPAERQTLRIALDRRHRGGKTVTLITGFRGTDEDLQGLCRRLKVKCGVGGTAKEGEIIIQGDVCRKTLDILLQEGYTRSRIV